MNKEEQQKLANHIMAYVQDDVYIPVKLLLEAISEYYNGKEALRNKMIILRGCVAEAREACAGSTAFNKSILAVMALVTKAMRKAFSLGFGNYEDVLKIIWRKLHKATCYEDRIDPDNMLADIVNKLDEEIKCII